MCSLMHYNSKSAKPVVLLLCEHMVEPVSSIGQQRHQHQWHDNMTQQHNNSITNKVYKIMLLCC